MENGDIYPLIDSFDNGDTYTVRLKHYHASCVFTLQQIIEFRNKINQAIEKYQEPVVQSFRNSGNGTNFNA